MIETATDVYAAVEKMFREAENDLRADMASAYKAGMRAGLLRVLHVLQDEFGVMPTDEVAVMRER